MSIQFLINHIDAMIMTVSGAVFTLYAYTRIKDLKEHSNKLFQFLPIIAPILLLIGVTLFFAPKNKPTSFTAIKVEEASQVTEGLVQIEFPGSPTSTKGNDMINGFEVGRVSHILSLAEGKIDCRFTINEYPAEYPKFKAEQMFEATTNHIISQGFSIKESSELGDGVWSIIAFQSEKGARIEMRLYIKDRQIHRATATSMTGYHKDPRIEKFIGSFKVRKID